VIGIVLKEQDIMMIETVGFAWAIFEEGHTKMIR
jgi:hypothetical protein